MKPGFKPKISYMRPWVPRGLGLGLDWFFLFGFQLSGAVYLSSMSEMYSAHAWLQEDIMFAGIAGLVGMTCIFPALWQFKFRLHSKYILLGCIATIIAANLITMHTHSRFVLILTAFIGGSARMWGNFECISNSNLLVNPHHNDNGWFYYIYGIVIGMMQISTIVAGNISWLFTWEYMHYFVIGLLCFNAILLAIFAQKDQPFQPYIPMKGFDFLSWALWAVALMSLCFVFEYGEHFDWLYSPYIRTGLVVAVVALLLVFRRMFTYEKPFIDRWTYFNPRFSYARV